MKIPAGYQQVMPYLVVKDAAKFLDFMTKVFAAEEKLMIMRGDKFVQHAELRIGESVVMFADATDHVPPRTAALMVYVEDADRTFDRAIAAGATPIMPVSEKEYGRCGGFADPFGNVWWPTTPPKE